MKTHVRTRATQIPLLLFIVFLLLASTRVGLAQLTPLTLGELGVEIKYMSQPLHPATSATLDATTTRLLIAMTPGPPRRWALGGCSISTGGVAHHKLGPATLPMEHTPSAFRGTLS